MLYILVLAVEYVDEELICDQALMKAMAEQYFPMVLIHGPLLLSLWMKPAL